MRRSVFPRMLLSGGLALALLFSGCGSVRSDYLELENLQVVQTLGLDEGDGRLTLTAATGGMRSDAEGVVLSRPADSIISGIEALHHYSSKEAVYLDHARFVLLGSSASENALPELCGFLERSSELRMDMTLFALIDGEAKALITGGAGDYDATKTLSSIETDVKKLGIGDDTTCREVMRATNEYGAALVCAVKSRPTAGAVYSESGSVMPVPAGYVITKRLRRCGLLDEKSAWAANLLLNKGGSSAVTLYGEGGDSAVLVTDGAHADYSALWSDSGELLKLTVSLKLKAGLCELTSGTDALPVEPETALNAYAEQKCLEVLELSRRLDADFLGLYGVLRGQCPYKAAAYSGSFGQLVKNTEFYVSAVSTVDTGYDPEAN